MSSSIWICCLFKPVNLNSAAGHKYIRLPQKDTTYQNKESWELLSKFNKRSPTLYCLDVWALATVAPRLVKNLLRENRVWQEKTAIKAAFVSQIKTSLYPFEKQHGAKEASIFLGANSSTGETEWSRGVVDCNGRRRSSPQRLQRNLDTGTDKQVWQLLFIASGKYTVRCGRD